MRYKTAHNTSAPLYTANGEGVKVFFFYASITKRVHKLILEVLEGIGLRVSELSNLKVTVIDFDKNLIFIIGSSGAAARTVPQLRHHSGSGTYFLISLC
ncbi:MAG: hypothetical protein HQK53_20030 [Oligoflexia bacterium]|nr:hypothetical protein [Oligoflexia bacterium]